MNGIPLFGLSAIQGEPTWCGVYSYGSYASNYPVVLNREMSTAGNTIGAIAYAGGDLYVSWKNGDTYGVDRLGNERAEKAVIITRVIDLTRESVKNGKVAVAWKSLPE